MLGVLLSLSLSAEYTVVELGRFGDKAEAVKSAQLASAKLHYPVHNPSLEAAAAERVIAGRAIALVQAAGKLAVTIYLGDADEAAAVLRDARKLAKSARLVTVTVDPAALDESYLAYSQTSILILGSYKTCDEAMTAAKQLAPKLALPFSTRGMYCDKARGLIWPDDFADDIYAGSYYGRRYDACDGERSCLSVERSEFYEGFTPNLYILVGGLLGDEAPAVLKKARQVVPDAYVKQTTVYLGCIH